MGWSLPATSVLLEFTFEISIYVFVLKSLLMRTIGKKTSL